jgi:type IV pilus assembly protein PilV
MKRSAGFTMLEVLVTLLIVASALLGTAGLQAYAIKTSHDSAIRSQAILVGQDLYERIEANNRGAIAGSYAVSPLPTSFTKDCSAEYCIPSELATYDLVLFNSLMQTRLPGSSATVTFAGAGPFVYTVEINWVMRITKQSGTTLATTGGTQVTSNGMAESFAYTFSKTVYDRSAVY